MKLRSLGQQRRDPLLDEGPRSHVPRLLLHPHELPRIRIPRENFRELLLWEGIELLDAVDGAPIVERGDRLRNRRRTGGTRCRYRCLPRAGARREEGVVTLAGPG